MNVMGLINSDIQYLDDLLLEGGGFKIPRYADIRDVPQNDISLFCVRHGMYCIPTIELIDFLRLEIGKDTRRTVEIGSGNGCIGKALGIIATDSYQQESEEMKLLYGALRQPTVNYGNNVIRMDAYTVIKKLNPRVVLSAWVTHLYNPAEHWREGNQHGIDEGQILKRASKYIFVGNVETHKFKPILDIPHRTISAEWLVSRSLRKDENVIYIWEKQKG